MVRTDLHELRGSAELYSGKEVTVAGWVRNIRASNAFGFIELNDGSTFSCLQIVIEESKLSNYNDIASLNIGAAIIAKGIFTLTPGAKQPYELKATEVTVEGASDPEYPYRTSATPANISARWRICVPAPTPSTRYSASVPPPLSLSTNFSTSAAICISTPR